MKEFGKWILEDECPVLSVHDEEQREKGWRAALECMLAQETSIAFSVPVVLTDIIREELKS